MNIWQHLFFYSYMRDVGKIIHSHRTYSLFYPGLSYHYTTCILRLHRVASISSLYLISALCGKILIDLYDPLIPDKTPDGARSRRRGP
jgi:hypothetical protein